MPRGRSDRKPLSRVYRDEVDVDWDAITDDLADYQAQDSGWLGALLMMMAFVAGGLVFACVEAWW
jgi:hypothetical protein